MKRADKKLPLNASKIMDYPELVAELDDAEMLQLNTLLKLEVQVLTSLYEEYSQRG